MLVRVAVVVRSSSNGGRMRRIIALVLVLVRVAVLVLVAVLVRVLHSLQPSLQTLIRANVMSDSARVSFSSQTPDLRSLGDRKER